MKAMIQRVQAAGVIADGGAAGRIENGLFVLLGVCDGDTAAEAELLARKACGLRIFCDENGKMNRSVLDTGGGVLVVSNFTLCADVSKGNRPSFMNAMRPDQAEKLYEYFIECVKNTGVSRVETGVFGADMKINAGLDGPVTILLDTDFWSVKQ